MASTSASIKALSSDPSPNLRSRAHLRPIEIFLAMAVNKKTVVQSVDGEEHAPAQVSFREYQHRVERSLCQN